MSASKKNKPDPHSPFASLRAVKEKLGKEEEARAAAGKKPPPAASARSPVTPSKTDAEEDRLAFHRSMTGVRPIEQTKGRVPKSAQVPQTGDLVPRTREADAKKLVEAETDEVHARLRALVEGKERFELEDDGRRIEGRRIDLPKELLRKLRRGQFPVDARLDLHGMGAADAREKVEGFLRDKRVAGERCVLIIHGKGEHSLRGQAVLRGEIGAWLSQGAASEHVGAFATAAQDDGGEGAVYVLIRR